MRLQNCGICIKICRLCLYKTFSLIKTCRNTVGLMSWITNIQNSYNSLSRSRKILLCSLVAAVFILYMWPHWLSIGSKSIATNVDPQELCLDAYMNKHKSDLDQSDVLIDVQPAPTQDPLAYKFHPFVGNGHVGVAVSSQEPLRIKYGRALLLPIPFYPVITVSLVGHAAKELTSLHIRDGFMQRLQCFQTGNTCVSVSSKTLAHRSRPGILEQTIRVNNPTDKSMTLTLEQIAVSDWQDVTSQTKSTKNSRDEDVAYRVSVGTVPAPDLLNKVIVVAVASVKVPDDTTVPASGTKAHQIVTAVKYTEPLDKGKTEEEKHQMADLAEKSLLQALNVNPKILEQEHTAVWNKQWHSGFGISLSKAPSAINGDRINATLYYVMSNLPAPMHEIDRPEREKYELERLLYNHHTCYEGHQTLQNDRLWPGFSSTDSLMEVVKLWIITMEKKGCITMLNAGADGMLQAMLLSFGSLHFRNDHLEFDMAPRDLHRDYFFRRLNYGNNTHVNISVIVGEDNKALLFVALDRNDRDFYVCDAGCMDSPVKLSREVVQLPVKMTDPHTAIMYITADLLHMNELKHTIHVKEIVMAPAHEHRVIALHKHGHLLGGLPMTFWVSIGFLIGIFHLFLFKLIFNEYCQGSMDRYGPRATKYNI